MSRSGKEESVNEIDSGTGPGIDAALRSAPHGGRHAHASHALDAGAPLSLVQATLGHANGAMTLRYTHAQPNTSSAQFLKL